ncbi:unnamed protein product [Arabidopsis thaliana]|uniref:Reverse transcriptase domain-containing protein n=1 Tax=Arabidopsis thaliana TaxID=3702 RepID=A0A5S9Y9C3_ARATH|nr:unnamed protein product [Arabidopsis thaliana]
MQRQKGCRERSILLFGMLTVPFRFELHSFNERPRNLIGIFAGSSGNQGGGARENEGKPRALTLGVNIKMITGQVTSCKLGMGINMYPSSAFLGRQWKEVSKGNLNPDVCRETCLYSVEHGILLIVDRCLTLFDNPLVDSLHTTYNELKLQKECKNQSKKPISGKDNSKNLYRFIFSQSSGWGFKIVGFVLRIMNMNLDQAIQEMSIKDDSPLILPNQEKFCSIERNNCSLMGRFLNPSHQRMSNWILDMPRIWRLYSRVRGVALSQDRFQFLFKSEEDLIEILKTGVWTQDEWCVIMERWMEKPSADFLMFLPVWIRLRNIPVNYYTTDTIKEIATCVGKVLKVELDLEKSQAQDYVRVNVLLDIRNPLRNCKDVQIPTGEVVSVTFDYERIRKRCFLCQRLTHEKADCPFVLKSTKSVNQEFERGSVKKKVMDKEIGSSQAFQVLPKGFQASDNSEDMQDTSSNLLTSPDDEIISETLQLDFSTGLHQSLDDAGSSGLCIRQKNPRKRKASFQRKKIITKEDEKDKEGILSWNCQGLRNPWTIRYLREMKKEHFPDILFLMETMNSDQFVMKIFNWLGYDYFHTIEQEGKSGGLAIFWKKHLELEFGYEDKNLLDVKVSQGAKSWFVSCVYGHPVTSSRHFLLDLLSSIGKDRSKAWCMIGDFNEILSNKEKLGGPSRLTSSFQGFKDMLSNYHRPVLVKFVNDQEVFRGQFRFDKRLEEDPSCLSAIIKSWKDAASTLSSSSMLCMVECRKAIGKWKKENTFNAQSKIKDLREELDAEKSSQFPCWSRISVIQDLLSSAFREEESFWRLKSRDKWLFGGDKNTKFFQASVKANRVKNSLSFLVDEDGNEQTLDKEKAKIALNFFENLFTTSFPGSMLSVLNGFHQRVTDEMNLDLTKDITEEEIHNAVFAIKGDGAPGPDGFTAIFFQTHWSLVKDRIIADILRFFHSGVLPEDWNHTHLCLIPKITNPQRMTDIRPISLCSVLYKIVSKILSARLKKHLPQIVSSTQSAFVAERLASDNILIAHEIMHNLKTNVKLSKEFVAFKTDMSKAYDRVEWAFLQGVLNAMGFNLKWISWIMACVTSVSFSVLINGQPFGNLIPERGIRQGDPLSPFLFVLCTEALVHILNQAEREGKISGIQFNGSGSTINHLLFADDTLLVCKATTTECEELMHCFANYSHISGQVINLEKSSITFGAKIAFETKEWIKNRSGIRLEGGSGKYLGLPECLSGSKKELFGFIAEKLQSRLTGWYAKTLSQGGKEVLLKSIAMAFPVYAMSCFKLPKNLCKKLSAAMMDFWWNTLENNRKIHWIGATKLTLPKSLGGFGFKDLQCFNQALLAKQAWRLLAEPNSLVSQIFKSRYYLNTDFLNASKGTRPSYAWQSILYGRDLLIKGLKKRIGNGENTFVWVDKWLFDGQNKRPNQIQVMVDIELKVSHLIDPISKTWNLPIMRKLFPWEDINLIREQRPLVSREDFYCWSGTISGSYTVKSGYDLISRNIHQEIFKEAEANPSVNPLYDSIWHLFTAPKIKTFLWKVLKGAVAVEDRLRTRGIRIYDGCLMCKEENETINHILFQCPLARQVWALSLLQSPVNGYGSSIFANMDHVLHYCQSLSLNNNVRFGSPWIIWVLWKHRNKLLFEGVASLTQSIVAKAYEDCNQWLKAQQGESSKNKGVSRWLPPPVNELKCNIGVAWSKQTQISGASWVVRDDMGKVLLHSRRSYSQVHSLFQAKLKSWEWALESMGNHKFERVIFGASSHDIIFGLHKPKEYPALLGHITELLKFTRNKPSWFMALEPKESNRGALEIAKSALTGYRWQSYVSFGFPHWLGSLFESEMTKH